MKFNVMYNKFIFIIKIQIKYKLDKIMEFKYQIKQDKQHEEDNNKLKELHLRRLQGKLGCKFFSLNNKQVQLYYQKQALIKLNELFIRLYEQNTQNLYLDFIYKFLDENNTIFNFKKDFLLSLL